MRDDEPDGPELTHNTDDTATEYGDLEDCVAQCHEARMAHIKNSHDLVTDHVDAWSIRLSMNAEETGRYRE
jgi:hypothetical protein